MVMARRATVRGIAAILLLLAALVGAVTALSPRQGAATGAVLATLTLGPGASGLALDTRTERAIVGVDHAGHAYIVDTRTATLLRTIAVPLAGASSALNRPMIGAESLVGVDERDGWAFVAPPQFGPPPRGLSIIDTGSGRLLASIPYHGFSGPWFAMDPRSRHLFTLDNPARVEQARVYDARSGHLIRVVSLDMPPFLPSGLGWSGDTVPVAVDAREGRVLVSRQTSNAVSMLDTSTGRLLRTVTIAPLQAGATSIQLMSLIVDERDGRVFVVSADRGTVTTLDARSGRLLRSVFVGQFTGGPVVDSATRRVFVVGGKRFSVLDARSGRLVSRSSGRSGWVGPPVVDEQSGVVLLTDVARRTVDVVDGMRGRVLRSLRTGFAPGSVAVDGRSGHVYVLDGGAFDPRRQVFTGTALLRVFDERTGRLLRAIALGPGFGRRIDIDARTRRAVILVVGGAPVSRPDPWGWLPPWARRALPFVPRPAGVQVAPSTLTVIDTSRL